MSLNFDLNDLFYCGFKRFSTNSIKQFYQGGDLRSLLRELIVLFRDAAILIGKANAPIAGVVCVLCIRSVFLPASCVVVSLVSEEEFPYDEQDDAGDTE